MGSRSPGKFRGNRRRTIYATTARNGGIGRGIARCCICPACPTDTCLVSLKVVQFSLQHTACSYGTALAAGSSTALAAPAIWRCTNGASSPASFSAPETWWPLISCRTTVTFPRPPAPPDSRHCSCRSSSSSSPVGNAQVREAPAIEMPAAESADHQYMKNRFEIWPSVMRMLVRLATRAIEKVCASHSTG